MISFLFQNLRKKNGSKNSFHKRVASSAEKVKKAKKHGLKRIKKDISSEARSNAKVRIDSFYDKNLSKILYLNGTSVKSICFF